MNLRDEVACQALWVCPRKAEVFVFCGICFFADFEKEAFL